MKQPIRYCFSVMLRHGTKLSVPVLEVSFYLKDKLTKLGFACFGNKYVRPNF